MLDTGK